ncbi:hypothetical protein [Sulfurimonas sp. HSL-1716]|uniref:hypothetical protein n=1 Tax=Hydrocurvibacter sulfurireducens TaxID=3131937 RepID=UPI0031F8765D
MTILFPDDDHIAASYNIEYRQAEIKPSEAILKPEFHWEGNRTHMYGTVIKKESGYEMYYQCGNALRIGYAISNDGLVWEKPMINAADFKASAHKVVQANDTLEASDVPKLGEGQEMTNLAAGYHMPSVIYEPKSEKPYKLFAYGEAGYRALYSKNGRQFYEYGYNPVIELLEFPNRYTKKMWYSDVAPAYKDGDLYKAMIKTYEIDADGRTRRCIGYSQSRDFIGWSSIETVWIPGKGEDDIAKKRGFFWSDFYGLCPFAYGSGYLGFLWLFEIEKELPRGTNQGKMEIFLAYSRDGKSWRRISDEAFIPWDLNFRDEGGMVTTPSAPVFEEDHIKLYYSDSNFEHGLHEKDFTKVIQQPIWVTRCSIVQKERLVGAASTQGWLQTCSLSFYDRRLRLNLACKNGEVVLRYLVSGHEVASQRVKAVDDTDLVIKPAYEGDAVLHISLENAAVYAIELI